MKHLYIAELRVLNNVIQNVFYMIISKKNITFWFEDLK